MQPRILLIEDERVWIRMFCNVLRAEGYDVVVAMDTNAGWSYLREQRFDLILMYIHLDDRWLTQHFLETAHSKYPEVPIVGYTASAISYSTVFGLAKMGIVDFIHKAEFDLDDFRQRIRVAMKSPSLRSRQIELVNETAAITVLFLAADPSDAARLRLGKELREIQDKLERAKLRDKFEVQQRMSARPEDISQALLDVRPQIVHFSGHGMTNGALCFENQVGEAHPIQPDALAALFEQFADQIQCVLLNACYTKAQADAIGKYINYVIGMNQKIGDKAAIAFAIGFYQALGAGRTIDDAYNLGCVQIRLQGIPEHLTPILVKKG
jgi:DNA-binding response OmpR family regulator